MAVLKNRAKMSTSTTGTGTITLGSAESGYQTFGDAGVANADVVRYVIEDGTAWEIGTGTYTATGTTLTRTVSESSNADAAIVLTGSATVFIGATAEDLVYPALYMDNPVSATAPVASGTNAVAIGSESESTGTNSIAIGTNATTNSGVAIGYNAQTTSLYATAIGSDMSGNGAIGAGFGSVALGASRAGGTDSFAAAITTNSASYGARQNNAVVLGQAARSTGAGGLALGNNANVSGSHGLAIGRGSAASGAYSTALGYFNTASGTNSVAFGANSTASHEDSIVLGDTASSSAINQITLGSTSDTVRISSAYTLPTADGTANQVLTTDGAGAVTFATAGGGSPDLFAENYDGTSTLPSATGTNALSLAPLSTSTGINSVSIGSSADATGNQAFSFGVNSTASGLRGISFGSSAFTNNTDAVAIGSSAQAQSVGGLALGHDATVMTGAQAVAIGDSYASGADSFAAAIANNTSSYGATGYGSFAIGNQAKASGSLSFAIDYQAQATGIASRAIGYQALSSGTNSFAIGRNANATGVYSYAIGASKSEINGKLTYGSGQFSAVGDVQSGQFILRSDTTDATAEALTTDNSSAITANQVILPNNSAYSFSGTIIARQQAADGSNYASWEIKGALLRDANAASTVLGNGIANKLFATAGASAWAIALTADTTNGGLKIEATGAAATDIRWVATVNTSEVTYA